MLMRGDGRRCPCLEALNCFTLRGSRMERRRKRRERKIERLGWKRTEYRDNERECERQRWAQRLRGLWIKRGFWKRE